LAAQFAQGATMFNTPATAAKSSIQSFYQLPTGTVSLGIGKTPPIASARGQTYRYDAVTGIVKLV
jgi:hypothetical protein